MGVKDDVWRWRMYADLRAPYLRVGDMDWPRFLREACDALEAAAEVIDAADNLVDHLVETGVVKPNSNYKVNMAKQWLRRWWGEAPAIRVD